MMSKSNPKLLVLLLLIVTVYLRRRSLLWWLAKLGITSPTPSSNGVLAAAPVASEERSDTTTTLTTTTTAETLDGLGLPLLMMEMPGAGGPPQPLTLDSLHTSGNKDFVREIFKISEQTNKSTSHGAAVILRSNPSSGGGGDDNNVKRKRRAIVLVTEPRDVATVLSLNSAHNLSGSLMNLTKDFIGRSPFTLEGEEWLKERAILRSLLSFKQDEALLANLENVAFKMCYRLYDHVKTTPYVDMYAVLCRMHISMVGKAYFSEDFNFFHSELLPSSSMTTTMTTAPLFAPKEEIIESFEYLLKELPARFRNQKRGEEEEREWKRKATMARRIVKELVSRRLSERGTRDGLEFLISFFSNTITDEEELVETVCDKAMDLLFAGYNTVVVGIAFTIFFLTQNPVWYQEVRKEIDSKLRSHDFTKSHPLFTSLNEMPLLLGAFEESLRLVPPTAYTARVTTVETPLLGGKRSEGKLSPVVLPPHTDVIIPIVFVNQHEGTWGEDAHLFNPSRWLSRGESAASSSSSSSNTRGNDGDGEEEEDFVAGGKSERKSSYAFSGGIRGCIGERLAKSEAVTALALLLHFFTFETPPGSRQKPTWSGFGIRPFDLSTSQIAMHMKVTKRGTSGIASAGSNVGSNVDTPALIGATNRFAMPRKKRNQQVI